MDEKIRTRGRRMTFEWKEIYSVGIKEIDRDHKKIFDYINCLSNDSGYNKKKECFDDIIKGLKEYVEYHFSKEEKIMLKIRFPDFISHKSKHQIFIDKLSELENKSKDFVLVEGMNTFLKDWMIDHILGSDMEYAKFRSEK